MPEDVVLAHELGYAVFGYRDVGPGAGVNVNKVENPYRAQRRAQIKNGRRGNIRITQGSYAPRVKNKVTDIKKNKKWYEFWK